jgi:hypothetical protein
MFWPENTRSKKYGQVFTVEHVAHQHYPNIRSWVFKINKKVTVSIFAAAADGFPDKISNGANLVGKE